MESGLLSPPSVPLFGGPNREPKKNRKMDGALTLSGRGLIETNYNQLGVGVRSGKDVGEEARGWESMWGGTVPSFGATIQTMKKNM